MDKKNGQEINDRDTLANYLFNEVPLDGITGIGKKEKTTESWFCFHWNVMRLTVQ